MRAGSGVKFILALSYQWRGKEHTYGKIGFVLCCHMPYGAHPPMSLKPGTTVAGGTGIATDPWVVTVP